MNMSQADMGLESEQIVLALALADGGRFREAIELLIELNRYSRSGRWERLMADWRYRAYVASRPLSLSRNNEWPPEFNDPFRNVEGIPEIQSDDLDARVLGGAIQHHGAILVRGLIDRPHAQRLAEGIRNVFDARDRWRQLGEADHADDGWYARLALPADSVLAQARDWVESAGGVWTADSPRMLFELIELMKSKGVAAAIADYFGEQPLLSVGKSTLRCVPHTIRATDWHQDGAFLGSNVRSVNLWLSLSDCGVDASGLDYLPKRMPRIVETGTHGACFPWSVGPALVEQIAEGTSVVTPQFAPGDALLFDHYFLHRTGIPAGIVKDRYAIESWFFAPAAYPEDQVPLMI